MEHKKIINKTEFARRIGRTKQTVLNMIKRNYCGIRDYLTDEGIDESIFDVEPFKKLSERYTPGDQTEGQATVQPAEGAEDPAAEPEQTEKRKQRRSRDELVTAYREQIRAQAETIKILQDQITAKDQQINALLAIQVAQQRAALPEPKQSLFNRIFRRNKKPERIPED